MNYFNHQNVQLAYEAVYNQDLCESMENLGLIGNYDYLDEEKRPYPEEKVTHKAQKLIDYIQSRAGKNPAPGELDTLIRFNRLHRSLDAHRKGLPQPIPPGRKGSTYRRATKIRTNESYELYNSLLGYLLDEGHADTIRALWAEKERESQNKENLHGNIERNILKLLKLGERPIPIRSNTSSTQIRHRVKKPARRSTEEAYELYNSLLEYLLDEGYADTLGSAEIILENMSDVWIDEILLEKAERSPLPIGKMKRKENKLKELLRDPETPHRGIIGLRLSTIEDTRKKISTRGGKADLSSALAGHSSWM